MGCVSTGLNWLYAFRGMAETAVLDGKLELIWKNIAGVALTSSSPETYLLFRFSVTLFHSSTVWLTSIRDLQLETDSLMSRGVSAMPPPVGVTLAPREKQDGAAHPQQQQHVDTHPHSADCCRSACGFWLCCLQLLFAFCNTLFFHWQHINLWMETSFPIMVDHSCRRWFHSASVSFWSAFSCPFRTDSLFRDTGCFHCLGVHVCFGPSSQQGKALIFNEAVKNMQIDRGQLILNFFWISVQAPETCKPVGQTDLDLCSLPADPRRRHFLFLQCSTQPKQSTHPHTHTTHTRTHTRTQT